MEIGLSMAVNLTCILTGLWAMSHIAELKEQYCVIRYIAVVLLALGQSFISLFRIPLLNTFSFLLILVGSTVICVNCKKFYFLLYDVLIAISAFVADLISTLSLSVLASHPVSLTLQSQNMIIARYLLNCILMFIFCNLAFSIVRRKHTAVMWYEVIFYLMLAVGETLVSAYIVKHIQDFSSGTFMIFFLLGCFILDIYVVLVFYRLSRGRETEKENALLRQQSNLQVSVYRDLQLRYQHSMRIVHDVKKHISALDGLIETDHMEEAERYKHSLYQELDKLHPTFQCENKLLSVIINHALIKAEQKRIRMHLQIEPMDLSFLSDMDLTTIVSNLLDNALEAVAELPEGKRDIYFVMEKKMGCYLIHSENDYDHIHHCNEQKFLSTKRGHMGIGLTNVEMVVKKYDGLFFTEAKDGRFIASVTLPS